MPESVEDLMLTPRARLFIEQVARFEQSWKAAIQGGDPPEIGAFLASFDEPARARLASELERIERTYRVEYTRGQARTIEASVERPEPSEISELDAVIEPPLIGLADASADEPDPSAPTWRLPPGDGDPPSGRNVLEPSSINSDPMLVPLLDSWGRDVEAPPIPGRLRTSSAPQPFLKGYEVIGELGRGGMGVVYKANQQGLNRLVAIKMVLGGDHARAEDLARFKVEAEAVASIQHPNIVQIYEVGDKDGTPYFSLEYIDGGTLHQRIDGKPQAPIEAATITRSLALAMGHFHERGVIHRDLKPANVLLTLQGSPKITDFGLAKRLEGNSSQTRTGSLMGTPSYMAPEQARGDTHAIGPLSDIYSLGAVLYEMLTGRPPFQGATMLDTIDQVRSQEPVPPRRLQPKIPRDLETICLKCLQKEPAKRYLDANELADDLGRFLENEPIKARPIGRIELGWRWARRNPRVAGLSLSIFLLGLTMIGLAGGFAVRAAREAQTINEARRIAVDRFSRAKAAVESGDSRQSLEILGAPDPFVEATPALAAIRDDLRQLRAQLQTFDQFRRLLDLARYYGLPSAQKKLSKAKVYLRELITLYDEIEGKKGRGEFGLPPLSAWQTQLFNEDIFDTFLVAAFVEYESEANNKDPEARLEAARRAVGWLDRAETLLPPTKALYARRSGYKKILEDEEGAEADREVGESIEPNSPVDIFWNGFADRIRADDAVAKKDPNQAREFYGLARDKFARHLESRPEHLWGYLEWANCLFRLGEHSNAVVGYTQCIRLRPDASLLYHSRAMAHAKLNQFESVVEDESLAIKYDPDSLEAYVGRAGAHETLGKLPEAIADFTEAIRLDPSKPIPRLFRGILRFKSENLDAALDDFNKVIELSTTIPAAYQNRAKLRFKFKDYKGSKADWNKFLSMYSRDDESHYYAGVLAMGFRRPDEAIRELNLSLALNPNNAMALLAKARIYHWQGDDAEALKLINSVVEKLGPARLNHSQKADYLNERVDLYRNLGRLDDSEADGRRSIELDPLQTDAYLALALLEKQRGKPAAEVQVWYDRMVEANPKSSLVHLKRAEFFRDLGRWDDALAEIEKARTLEMDNTTSLTTLVRAGVLAARGDVDKATADADAVLKGEAERIDGPSLYAAACVWSLASGSAAKVGDPARARRLGDRATELLKRTLDERFHDLNYQAEERMLVDPALDPIRDRAEVRKLLTFLP